MSGDCTELLDNNLPIPNYFYRYTTHAYSVGWLVDGYFATTKAKMYLNDIVARFLVQYPSAVRLYSFKIEREDALLNAQNSVKLSDIAESLPSLPKEHERCRKRSWKKKKSVDTKVADLFAEKADKINKDLKDGERVLGEDRLFEATRWHLYRKAYTDGTDSITEDYAYALLNMENEMLTKPREHSAVKGKARRMSEYMQKDFVLLGRYADMSKGEKSAYMRAYRQKNKTTKKEDIKMTRIERANANSAKKAEVAKAKIQIIMFGLMAPEYKKKTGTWHIGKISRDTNLSELTVSKYIKQIEKEK